MKSEVRAKLTTTTVTVSEWEDNVLFDADDPDFGTDSTNNATRAPGLQSLNAIITKVPSNVSIVDMQNSAFVDSASLSLSSSLVDWMDNSWEPSSENVPNLEQLRKEISSCFTCGVSWTDEHVSLDCAECGSYSLERPCPKCDGICGAIWKRDITMSHTSRKARWQGCCLVQSSTLISNQIQINGGNVCIAINGSTSISNQIQMNGGNASIAINGSTSSTLVSSLLSQATPQTCGVSPFLANELCARLERLSASTHA